MGKVLLSSQGVVKKYGGLVAVNNVDLNMDQQEIVSVVGPNGAGKTTLFDCITGMTRMDAGNIVFLDEDITGMSPHQIARKGIARTFQLTRIFPGLTVLENVIMGQIRFLAGSNWKTFRSIFRQSGQSENTDVAMNLIEQVKLSGREHTVSGNLPIGERKRLELAIALATKPKLLFLDEPVAGMNPSEADEVISILYDLKAGGLGICIVEHHMRMVMGVSDRIIVLNLGRKIAEGTPEEVSQNPAVIEAYLGKKRGILGK